MARWNSSRRLALSVAGALLCGSACKRAVVDQHASAGAVGSAAIGVAGRGASAAVASSPAAGAPNLLGSTSDAGAACLDTSQCTIAPSDVACDANTECVLFALPACACGINPVIGVREGHTPVCAALSCPATASCGQPKTFESQDCKVSATTNYIAIACVAHQCRTRVVSGGG